LTLDLQIASEMTQIILIVYEEIVTRRSVAIPNYIELNQEDA